MATTPDATALATSLAGNVGDQVIDTAVALAPVAVPFVLAMTAIGWVLRKFGLKKNASLKV